MFEQTIRRVCRSPCWLKNNMQYDGAAPGVFFPSRSTLTKTTAQKTIGGSGQMKISIFTRMCRYPCRIKWTISQRNKTCLCKYHEFSPLNNPILMTGTSIHTHTLTIQLVKNQNSIRPSLIRTRCYNNIQINIWGMIFKPCVVNNGKKND